MFYHKIKISLVNQVKITFLEIFYVNMNVRFYYLCAIEEMII